jgi:hypothetical protein
LYQFLYCVKPAGESITEIMLVLGSRLARPSFSNGLSLRLDPSLDVVVCKLHSSKTKLIVIKVD